MIFGPATKPLSLQHRLNAEAVPAARPASPSAFESPEAPARGDAAWRFSSPRAGMAFLPGQSTATNGSSASD